MIGIGAIVGDIVGSKFEFNNHRSKEFPLFDRDKCFPTDDSIMTLAINRALVDFRLSKSEDYSLLSENTVKFMRSIGQKYPNCGYGGSFRKWMFCDDPKPYFSYGNGAAMRVSGCGWAGRTIKEVERLASSVTIVTHDHPEGLLGAEAVAIAVFLARKGLAKPSIKEIINNNYYHIDFTLDQIRQTYKFNETCQNTVPQAFEAFFESTGFEDAIRNAISIGGDSDTLAAITGAVAEAYYGIPNWIQRYAMQFLDAELRHIADSFSAKFEF